MEPINPKKHEESYFDRGIQRILEYEESSPRTKIFGISRENLEHLRRYYLYLDSNYDKIRTIHVRLKIGKYFLVFLQDKKLEDAKREDVEKYICSLKNLKKSTKEIYKIQIKLIFQWFYKSKKKEYPEIVDWIEINNKRKDSISEYEILSKAEKKRMVQSANCIRDKCLISTLGDSAARISELTGMKIKDCLFDEYGCKIKVSGKTGKRKIRLVESTPLLKEWINSHPLGQNKENPLFICIGRRFGQPLDSAGAYKIVASVRKRAKITKKVTPHVFRHTRLTELAKEGLNEFELRFFAGWSKNSKMSEIYIHIGEKEVDDKVLKLNGIKKSKPEEKENPLETKKCFSCGEINNSNNKFCSRCKQILDINAEKEINIKDNLLELIEGDSEIKNKLIEKLKEQFKQEILTEIMK